MQLVLIAFGRALHLTLNSYQAGEDAEYVALDGPANELAEDSKREDASLPFGFHVS